MLLVTSLLVLLVQVVCKSGPLQCLTRYPLPIFHKYYQSGDLLIAGVVSLMFKFSDMVTFEVQPSPSFSDTPL